MCNESQWPSNGPFANEIHDGGFRLNYLWEGKNYTFAKWTCTYEDIHNNKKGAAIIGFGILNW